MWRPTVTWHHTAPWPQKEETRNFWAFLGMISWLQNVSCKSEFYLFGCYETLYVDLKACMILTMPLCWLQRDGKTNFSLDPSKWKADTCRPAPNLSPVDAATVSNACMTLTMSLCHDCGSYLGVMKNKLCYVTDPSKWKADTCRPAPDLSPRCSSCEVNKTHTYLSKNNSILFSQNSWQPAYEN